MPMATKNPVSGRFAKSKRLPLHFIDILWDTFLLKPVVQGEMCPENQSLESFPFGNVFAV